MLTRNNSVREQMIHEFIVVRSLGSHMSWDGKSHHKEAFALSTCTVSSELLPLTML